MKVTKNKIGVLVYLPQDTYVAMENIRNPNMPKSVFCATVIEEALGINR